MRAGGVAVEFATRDRSSARVVPGIIGEARAELAGSLALSAPEKVTVKLLRAREAFLGVSAGKPVELYAGRAYPTSGTIHVNMIALDREGRAIAFPRTVRHEFVHLAVGHTLGVGKLPRWFEEGLACAFGSPLPRARADVLRTGRAFRLGGLEEFPREEALVSLAYAQSDSVVRFLIGERGTPKVKELLRLVGQGARFEEALSRATGYTVASLDAEWRGSLASNWPWRLVRFVFSPS
ncbi:MAG: peptidase MA family metallohydrolase, partial [Planctomycetota bacterium]